MVAVKKLIGIYIFFEFDLKLSNNSGPLFLWQRFVLLLSDLLQVRSKI
jgi:hypothetical protein